MELYIMRHAQAEPSCPSGQDIDRNLTENGLKQANVIGQFIKNSHWEIQHILYSPANRAKETALQVYMALKNKPSLSTIDEMYMSPPTSTIFEYFRKYQKLLIVGHNPFVSNLTFSLTGKTEINFYTATIYKLEGDPQIEDKFSICDFHHVRP
ncbi:MAG: phosphohistidine phosphatase SixA [Lentisphaeria bacterium]|nr:phosphohistidine phosphatase SixA [Lentisphaeria bacterium]